MVCRRDAVDVYGWNASYSVDISSAGRGRVTSSVVPPEASQGKAPGNLGNWAKAQVLDLETDGVARFQLVITRASQRVQGGVEHHTISRLIRRGGRYETIAASRTLFEGVSLETVD
jgi:hypothetical protein